MSLLIKNARLRSDYRNHKIYLQNGIVSSIDGKEKEAEKEIDVMGSLLTESYVIAHLHLDKVYTYSMAGEKTLKKYQGGKDTVSAIKQASKIKESLDEHIMYKNASRALNEALSFGVSAIRAFADVDNVIELKGIGTLIRLKKEFSKKIEIQVVAFPQEGLTNVDGIEELIEKAVEEGADVVGGIPWIEKLKEQKEKHVEKILQIAVKHKKDVAMLVDDCCSPSSKTLEMLAKETVRMGWIGRVQACHARSMQLYDKSYLKKLIALCRSAGISFVINPHTGPCNAPVERLIREGITVALGQDDCCDAYYPFGRCKMTEVAFLASHILRMMSPRDLEILYDMITLNPAKAIGLRGFGIAKGNPARMVILPVKSVYEAIWHQAEPVAIINREDVLQLKEFSLGEA